MCIKQPDKLLAFIHLLYDLNFFTEHRCSALFTKHVFVQTCKNLILISTLSVNTFNLWVSHTLIETLIIKIYQIDENFLFLCFKIKLSPRVNIYLPSQVSVLSQVHIRPQTDCYSVLCKAFLTRKLLSRVIFAKCAVCGMDPEQWMIHCRELTEKVSPGNFQFWASENNTLNIQIVAGF